MIESLLLAISLILMILGVILIIVGAFIGGLSGCVVVHGTLKFPEIGAVMVAAGIIIFIISKLLNYFG